ncbi:hypothetical protein [Pseudomonas iridis]|uniref:hypothetical protein n=1 Tax=Pseudomonas iridis TaxID=2710587 RepID=UPI001B318A96|nr:hypothetical protein [Pseudomonas iridis]MBP5971027.1 hypothetical protein [Pseudomonas iridis]
MSRQALHTQMMEHARCLSLPQVIQSIDNLGGGNLPAIELVLRNLLLDVYSERQGAEAAYRLMTQLGIAQPGVLLA